MQLGTEIDKMTRELFRCRRQRHAREDVRRGQGPGLCQLRVPKFVQLSLSIRLELPDPRRYIEPKKGLRNEKLHSTNRSDSVVGHLLCFQRLPRPLNPKHIRGGFMVALKVSLHKSPAMYRDRALRGGPNIKAACNKT